MKTKIIPLMMAVVMIALMLVGCGPQSTASALPGAAWKLVSYGETQSGAPAGLTFQPDGKVSGNSGCNSFSGEYTLKNGEISFGALASTMMACPDPAMQQEAAVFQALTGTVKYSIEAGQLTIFSASGTPALVFTQGK